MLLGSYVGFKVWFNNGAASDVRGDATWKFVERYRKPITIEYLIALLWIGDEAEVDKALATLKSETGEDFRTAKDWTRWLEQTTL